MRTYTLVAVAVAVMAASPAFAQEPAGSFSDLSKVVKRGQVVFVEDDAGVRVKGNISDLSDSSLEIMTGNDGREVRFTADKVARVSKADSRVNGFLIGTAIGVAAGIYSGSFVDMLLENEGSDGNSAYALFGGLMGLAGGGIGYAIDGAIDGQKLVYTRRGGAAGSQVRLNPIAGKGVGGLRLSVQF